jgi:hypothetical protein
VRALNIRHRRIWVEQARRLLAATEHEKAHSPTYVNAQFILGQGGLLEPATEQALTYPVRESSPDRRWAEYEKARTEHVERRWSQLPLR